MGEVKQIEIELIIFATKWSISKISNLLKIDKKHYKGNNIYYIGYIAIKKIDNCENIYSVNPLYLIIDKVDWHIEWDSAEEYNGSKYLVFDSTDENKEVLKKYTEI